ncbi:LLM class flavin-dependent oxidoreductase [Cellulomonas fimi]|uniref:Luciferase-like, subgroup n=1 Tax=Cellulomonas fimi (strain ATCC 484 / DSM 20113 / JCM 1341 / CCUG 24087 / LMG 16345 / NBRC 15513 / NCIMB 8980 / NCTC 7547 / NRS-133) TaxID=590998 RepID=F4H3A3_CELFA|nr:LLM class flavin-dependent oxidoreductase [Cellulomonas fimi]AEE45324.1 Luciferase-like, subgroup [Cellulomonas fimi ATCC 484]NNH07893.1 LLM class flavin-dependent oxidoreductase [Cellulomonas fimi]VEH28966.1 Nitrilotriacetate monooxygenase component A [Cellulomonas fimi]
MTVSPRSTHLGLDLSDAGPHPEAWRTSGSEPHRLFDPERLRELVDTAQRATLDFVLFDDAFALHTSRNTTLRGRLDAALVSARLAPRSAGIGLVATVDTTHTEPFHVAKALQTIDHVSHGRAAWQVAWSTSPQVTAAFGRKQVQDEADAVAEADEAVDVVRKLWDSWEDDAEIRDVATGRFVDRDKIHRIDHEGVRFVVRGSSITPRSPQGQPPVVVRATSSPARAFAAHQADVVRIAVTDRADAAVQRAEIRAAAAAVGRDPDEIRVLADVLVVLGGTAAAARERLALLDALAGDARRPDGYAHVGTAAELAATVEDWTVTGAVDGFVLRPAALHTDVDGIADEVVPLLRAAGAFRDTYPGTTLRDTLGLARPASRYASAIA